jgi:hypothetical protein
MSSLNKLLENLRRTDDLIASVTRRTSLDVITDQMDRIAAISGQLSRINFGHVASLSSQMKSIVDAISVRSDSASHVASLVSAPALANIQAISETIARITAPSVRLGLFGFKVAFDEAVESVSSYSNLYSSVIALRDAAGFPSSERFDAAMEDFGRRLEEVANAAPANRELKLFWYSQLISLLLFVLGLAISQMLQNAADIDRREFENWVKESITKLSDKIESECAISLEPAPSHGEQYEFFIVERRAPIRERPRQRSTVVSWLHAGRLVWVRGRRGRWVYVNYVDVLGGETHRGWVLKKYLHR